MDKKYRILAINPGSTSTKVAVYDDEQLVASVSVNHTAEDLAPFKQVAEEFSFRKNAVLKALEAHGIPLASLNAVSGRGGGVKPVPSGTFRINEEMAHDCRTTRSRHVSLLGPLIALELAKELNIPAFMVDPVNVDEYDPVARISGIAGKPRMAGGHALNHKATARKAAKQLGRDYFSLDLIVAHCGGGISIIPHKHGRMVDMEGTLFSPERVSPRANDVVDMCFSGQYTKEQIQKILMGNGGMYTYFGTKDVRDVEKMIETGNQEAELVFHAMAYNVCKAIGACYSVLHGKCDGLVVTGGIAHSKRFINIIKDYCGYIDPILVFPGENELESLAMGALRVMKGEEKAHIYPTGEFEA